MTRNVQQQVVLENGGTIWLPPSPNFPNTNIPDLSKPDTAQRYDIGCAYVFNGKAYYYAYAGGAVKSRMGASIKNPQDILYRACPTTAAIYATSIYATTVSPDGPSANGTFTKDYLKGGHVQCSVGTNDDEDFSRGIVGNSAVTTAGTIRIDLDGPIPHEVTASTAYIEAMASQYANIEYNGHVMYPKVGLPTCYAAAGKWVWVQTWGACWIAPASTVGVNGAIGVVFRQDGSLDKTYQTVSDNISSQYAGYTIAGVLAGTQAAPFVYLQIAHP